MASAEIISLAKAQAERNKLKKKISPPNPQPVIDALKSEGYAIEIRHFRKLPKMATIKVDRFGWGSDKVGPKPTGGSTTATIQGFDFVVGGRAHCCPHDQFTKKIGTGLALIRAVTRLGLMSLSPETLDTIAKWRDQWDEYLAEKKLFEKEIK
jgi:hypothetical protein